MQDPVGDWVHAAKVLKSADYIKNLKTEASYCCILIMWLELICLSFCQTLLGAHWVHLENPKDTNRLIRNWFDQQRFKIAHEAGNAEKQAHLGDEL